MSLSGILIRFDDIHPEMNWEIWDEIVNICKEKNIKPIIAVIPNNKDESIVCSKPREQFWDEIKQLQNLGWGVALHGYEHLYTEELKGIVGLHNRSEFSGLSREIQNEKIYKAKQIFIENNIKPQLFIAPSHSFDETTIKVLLSLGIDVISDGFAIAPYRDANKMTWIPCQRWRFGFNMFGVWTICLHPNNWSKDDIDSFRINIEKYKSKIIDFQAAQNFGKNRKQPIYENILEKVIYQTAKLKFRFL